MPGNVTAAATGAAIAKAVTIAFKKGIIILFLSYDLSGFPPALFEP